MPTSSTFQHLRSQKIESLNLEAHEFRHRATGARHLHLAAEDNNNVFAVAFHTIPQDSTGVAHILEHTTLCGSRRYPVRDPFFMMSRRSLNTFMNAFTASDWTAYPFASQNPKDFYNLLQVYLDAVFFPNLHELDFAQEGHRLEFSAPDDANSTLVIKGVVYNEMKGAMSSPVARLWHSLCAELFSTTTYRFNSGGDPAIIPQLTYAQLKEFHARYYHPSNALFATYGDLDVTEHQRRIEDLALRHFATAGQRFQVSSEHRYLEPKTVLVPYPLDEDELEARTHIVLGWLWGNTTDLNQLMDMHLLANVLLDNSASPLRYALETSTLGTAPSELCGLESGQREATFVCGLEGSRPEHAEAVRDMILGVITHVASHGVEKELLDAVLHQMEIAQREIRGGSHPYGLQLLESAIPTTLHGGDAIAILAIESVLENLRVAITDPDYIKALARRWLLDNSHRVQVVMYPDPGLSVREGTSLQSVLEAKKAQLSATEKQLIVDRARLLERRQAETVDPEILPKVSLIDVPTTLKIPLGQTTEIARMPVTCFHQGTNGIIYQSVVVPINKLAPAEVDQLHLYTSLVTELGCGQSDYVATQKRQAAVCGGISSNCALRNSVDSAETGLAYFRLDISGLARNLPAMTELLHDTYWNVRFDELDRIRELIAQMCAVREAEVTDHGHTLAAAAAAARLNPIAAMQHRWDGLLGLQRLKDLNKSFADADAVQRFARALKSTHALLTSLPRQLLLVSEAKHLDNIKAAIAAAWLESNPSAVDPALPSVMLDADPTPEAWLTTTEVNFCAKAYPAVPAAHKDAATLHVLGRFLVNGFLHRAIREQGGAYGSGAFYDSDTATFRFFSYRDPRLAGTLADFDNALDWLQTEQHEFRHLEEAILGVISAIDRPSSPAGEAMKAFTSTLYGRTPDYLLKLRAQVLKTTITDIKQVASRYLLPTRARTAVIASAAALKRCPEIPMTNITI